MTNQEKEHNFVVRGRATRDPYELKKVKAWLDYHHPTKGVRVWIDEERNEIVIEGKDTWSDKWTYRLRMADLVVTEYRTWEG